MIIIYSTPACIYCDKAKDLFEELHVGYVDYDVSKDLAKRKEMLLLSGKTSVPYIIIDNHTMWGFNEKLIREYVKQL